MELRPIKACHNCRASYTLPMWDELAKTESREPGEVIEERRCICGTVLRLDRRLAEGVHNALPPEPEK